MTTTPKAATPRSGAARTGRGPTDRQRRQRIIDATLEVITDQGISGLSHRRIAAAAGVPLSATTYYFGTLDELLEQAFLAAAERDRVRLSEDMQALNLDSDAADAIARLTARIIDDRAAGVLALELCVAALRSERLRPLAQAWDETWQSVLEPYVGAPKAALVSATMAGIIMRESMTSTRMPTDELVEMFRSLLA